MLSRPGCILSLLTFILPHSKAFYKVILHVFSALSDSIRASFFQGRSFCQNCYISKWTGAISPFIRKKDRRILLIFHTPSSDALSPKGSLWKVNIAHPSNAVNDNQTIQTVVRFFLYSFIFTKRDAHELCATKEPLFHPSAALCPLSLCRRISVCHPLFAKAIMGWSLSPLFYSLVLTA